MHKQISSAILWPEVFHNVTSITIWQSKTSQTIQDIIEKYCIMFAVKDTVNKPSCYYLFDF